MGLTQYQNFVKRCTVEVIHTGFGQKVMLHMKFSPLPGDCL